MFYLLVIMDHYQENLIVMTLVVLLVSLAAVFELSTRNRTQFRGQLDYNDQGLLSFVLIFLVLAVGLLFAMLVL